MLSEKDLIGVGGKIHILNICACETPAMRFAEVRERPPAAVVEGLPSSAGSVGWLARAVLC